MTSKLKITEAQVSKAIVDFLRAEGWRVERLQSGLFRQPGKNGKRVRIGEPGRADYFAVRVPSRGPYEDLIQFFYFEVKAPRKKPTAKQQRWLEDRRRERFLAVWFDSFDRPQNGFAEFLTWYQETFR